MSMLFKNYIRHTHQERSAALLLHMGSRRPHANMKNTQLKGTVKEGHEKGGRGGVCNPMGLIRAAAILAIDNRFLRVSVGQNKTFQSLGT